MFLLFLLPDPGNMNYSRDTFLVRNAGNSMNYYTMTSRSVQASKTDGTLWTWGYNDKGQLGLSDGAARSSPVQVPGIVGTKQVVNWTDGIGLLYTDSTP